MVKKIKIIALVIVALLLLGVAHFFIIKQLDKKVLENGFAAPVAAINGGSATLLPSFFVDGERFYFKMTTKDGDTINSFGDTGGGLSMLLPHAKTKSINANTRYGIVKGIMPIEYILFSDLIEDSNFPKPLPSPRLVLRNPFKQVSTPYLLIPPMDGELKLMNEVQPEMHVFLGQDFFIHQSWTFDYLNQEIWVNTPINSAQPDSANIQRIGFKKNANNDKMFGHPSMTIEIDGETIDVLFDTGATMVLSDDGRKQFDTDKKTLGGSFIANSILEKWKVKHPDWKYYPKADLIGDIIEVPLVKIGGYEVGPVLFAGRPDVNWSQGMIASMDKVVKGAVGGSAFKYLKVTIDYNSELVKFEK